MHIHQPYFEFSILVATKQLMAEPDKRNLYILIWFQFNPTLQSETCIFYAPKSTENINDG